MKIKVTKKKITYLEAKTIQENQPEISLQKLFNPLIANLKQKKLLSLMKKILSFNHSKVITAIPKPKTKPTSTHQSRPQTRPSSQTSSQTQSESIRKFINSCKI